MFEVQHRQFMSAKWWHSKRSQIDMDPKYQRSGSLWKLEDQQSLIDTMINGFDMPKLYLADFTTLRTDLNEKNMRYAVVDGKQRLSAIFSFLNNEIPLSPYIAFLDDTDVNLGGLFYKDLLETASEIASRVEEFPMPVMHVVTDDAIKIRELFLRLNKGLVLTGPEKRNAMLGSVPDAITAISAHEFFGNCTSYQSSRGQHLNNAAKLLAFELKDGTADTKKAALDNLVEEYADSETELAVAKSEILELLDRMMLVFGHRDSLLRSAGSVPAFYWFVRDINLDSLKSARAFLNEFHLDLRDKNKIEEDSEFGKDLREYQRALRSINDKWSHDLRYETLKRNFDKYRERIRLRRRG
ncbi:DUF262 domain-containing protein [Mesorhizobium sp. M1396]|uniref:DUF262 domain-containing protein n=1 Tax=Mesorhizobium sp. M1396 TaxID=2957095 RepID=UPI003336700B